LSAILQCDTGPTKDSFKMYNLNVNVASSAAGSSGSNFLGVENSCTTPKTPEILNSLIAMTNPFDGYGMRNVPRIASCPPGGSDTSSSSGGSPLGSPCCNSPPSVQHTCSQLIKEGLKLTIQTKRRNTGRHLENLDAPRGSKMARRDEVSRLSYLFSPSIRLSQSWVSKLCRKYIWLCNLHMSELFTYQKRSVLGVPDTRWLAYRQAMPSAHARNTYHLLVSVKPKIVCIPQSL
jgi:hypothetical protein